MTGLSRLSIAVIGLAAGILAVCAAWILDGAASFCGFAENQVPTGYCAASAPVRASLVGVPAVMVVVGYAISLRMARLTPVALAAFCAVAGGLVMLVSGW